MSDFKMNTAEVLMAKLNINQFSFESLNGNAKKINQEIFEQAALYMPVVELEQKLYYRARIINETDGEKAGIIRKNGIPITGYDVSHSGVAPADCIKENGRVNHTGEQVLYLAEDAETSCKENKPDKNSFLSVAECRIKDHIKVADFSITVSTGLEDAFPSDIIQLFRLKYGIDIRALYMFIKDYMKNPNYKGKEVYYAYSLAFLDKIKKRTDLSGVKYASFFTGKFNIALWDENKFLKCKNSRVVKYL